MEINWHPALLHAEFDTFNAVLFYTTTTEE